MEIWMAIVAAGVLLIAGSALVALRMKAQHRQQGTVRLQRKFGSEYGQAVEDVGRKKGEAELVKREERVEGFDLHPLKAAEAERFTGLWTATQARFVDDPGGAIADADSLLGQAMQARGYPVSEFEQRAADVSVNHAEFVANYRAAHTEALKHSRGESSTEDLRQAMVHYRWLFTDLVAQEQQPELQAATA
jgi:hypothetical protein